MSEVAILLVLECGPAAGRPLRALLAAEGYDVRAASASEGPAILAGGAPCDLVVLALDLPEEEVTTACAPVAKAAGSRGVPVLVVSARTSAALTAAVLDGGAEDIVPGNSEPAEILARIRAARRSGILRSGLERMEKLYLDLFSHTGASVTPPFHLDHDLARILDHALHAVGAPRGRLLLYEPHRKRLVVRAVSAPGGGGADLESRVPEGPPPPGVLRLPIVGHEDPLGTLEVDFRSTASPDAGHERLLGAVAAQAAMFIENSRLNREVRRMFLDIIVALAGAVDAKDAYTHGHTVRVARVALLVDREMGRPAADTESLLLAALLHDVGKIGIPDSILKKPSKLDPEEQVVMREHPVLGAQMLRHIRSLRDVLPGIRHHHEHWDGSGYPDGLAGESIPAHARVILVADAFDALTSDRVYRSGVPVPAALETMGRFRGRQFDPDRLDALESLCAAGKILTDEGEADLFELIRGEA